jgi:hypothetical protein
VWLFGLALVALFSTGQMGGLAPIARRVLPPVDWLEFVRTLVVTRNPIEALGQPAILDYFSFVLGLADLSTAEWLPRLAVLFSVTLLLLTLALLLDGTMIATAHRAYSREGDVPFTQALRAGWQNILHLFLLASVPATPILVTMISLAISLFSIMGANNSGNLSDDATVQATFIALGAAVLILIPAGLFTLVFETLRHFANRACVIEGRRFFKAYGRAWHVLRHNPEDFILVFLVRVVVGGAVGAVLTVPGFFLVGVPLVWLSNAALKAFFSILWTLTWVDASSADLS